MPRRKQTRDAPNRQPPSVPFPTGDPAGMAANTNSNNPFFRNMAPVDYLAANDLSLGLMAGGGGNSSGLQPINVNVNVNANVNANVGIPVPSPDAIGLGPVMGPVMDSVMDPREVVVPGGDRVSMAANVNVNINANPHGVGPYGGAAGSYPGPYPGHPGSLVDRPHSSHEASYNPSPLAEAGGETGVFRTSTTNNTGEDSFGFGVAGGLELEPTPIGPGATVEPPRPAAPAPMYLSGLSPLPLRPVEPELAMGPGMPSLPEPQTLFALNPSPPLAASKPQGRPRGRPRGRPPKGRPRGRPPAAKNSTKRAPQSPKPPAEKPLPVPSPEAKPGHREHPHESTGAADVGSGEGAVGTPSSGPEEPPGPVHGASEPATDRQSDALRPKGAGSVPEKSRPGSNTNSEPVAEHQGAKPTGKGGRGKGSRKKSGVNHRSASDGEQQQQQPLNDGGRESKQEADQLEPKKGATDSQSQSLSQTPMADGVRRNSNTRRSGAGRGRGRRRSSSSRQSHSAEGTDDDEPDQADSEHGFVSVEARTRRARSRLVPRTQLIIANDDEPERLTNPLLAMVPTNLRREQNELAKKLRRDLASAEQGSRQGTIGGGSSLVAAAAALVARGSGGSGRGSGKGRRQRTAGKDDSPGSSGYTEGDGGAPKATGVIPVEEFIRSASIVFHRPDTYPLSFLARLLGFDVDVPDCTEMLVPSGGDTASAGKEVSPSLPRFPTPLPDPQTLPLRKDRMFLTIPKEENLFGNQQHMHRRKRTASNRLGDSDDQRVLDYMDPIYKLFLQHGWESSRCTAAPRPKCLKFINEQRQQESIRQKVTEMAREVLGLSRDWTFQDWGSFQSQSQREEREREQAKVNGVSKCDATAADGSCASDELQSLESAKETPVPSSSTLSQHRRPRRQDALPLWTIDGKQVFRHMPQHVFGILALHQGQPIALLRYQLHWYRLPTSRTAEHNQDESGRREDELIMIIDGIGYPKSDPADKSDGTNRSADGANNSEPTGGKSEGNKASGIELPEEKRNNVCLEDETTKGMIDNVFREAPSLPVEATPNDEIEIVMMILALEHTRACGVFYAVWDTPEPFVAKNECFFRMVKLHRSDTVEVPKEGTVQNSHVEEKAGSTDKHASGSFKFQPMICDLKKCSSRLAILKLKEGKERGTSYHERQKEATAKNEDFGSSPMRLLVEMPSFAKASTYFNSADVYMDCRHSKRGLDTESTCTNIYSGATGQTRDVSLKLKAKIDPSDESQVGVNIVYSNEGSQWRTQPVHSSQAMKTPQHAAEGEVKECERKGKGCGNEKETCIELNESNSEGHISWNLMKCFPIMDKLSHSPGEAENEILNKLTMKQNALIAMEGSLEPQARRLLTKTIEERIKYESSESVERRRNTKNTLMKFQDYLFKRRKIDQVRQELREEDMDAVCSICQDGDVSPDNQILFCESCNIAVHQKCYGVERIPEGDYYCIACRHFERDKMIQSLSETSRLQARADLSPLPIVCELCPSTYGAFTRLQNPKADSDPSDVKWVHMMCAKWQGLDFVNKGDASLVEDTTQLKQSYRRKNVSCCICKGSRGAYVKCRECDNWCHITCARESGLCEVVHGEDVKGIPIEDNPWSILCPEHSSVEKKQKNSKRIEELIKASKDLPDEPEPPPLLEELGPYNKLTGEQRKVALSVREYEDKYIADILKTKLSGVRCEVCDTIEDIHGRNLSRCEVCGSVICHTCELFPENPGQRSFKCFGCRFRSERKGESEPQCSMCNQKGGILVNATSAPMDFKKAYWNKNEREFERSLYKKAMWAHISCTYWLKDVMIDHNAKTVDLSNVIAANGKHFIQHINRCGLCGMRNGYKTKCSAGRCHAHGEMNKPYHFHVTCARQVGFEVSHNEDDEFIVNCYIHGTNENNLRARLEDLIEMEKKRAGKDFSRSNAPMKFSDGSKLLHGGIMVMRILGWAWRWAEWWVQYGSTWEPLLEPGQDELMMTPEDLRIVESTAESRMNDARRCRLSAFGAALRNRCYDTKDGFNNEALGRALRAILHTQTLVGPLDEYEIAFFSDLLARAYRSKSRLLGFGEDKIPVANEAFCLHKQDNTPKFELCDRPLPGKQVLPLDQIYEIGVSEPDDFLLSKNTENDGQVDHEMCKEIDYKYKGMLKVDSDSDDLSLSAVIETSLFDKENSYILTQRRGRIPKIMNLQIVVKVAGERVEANHSPRQRHSAIGIYKASEEKMNFDTEGFGHLPAKKIEFLEDIQIRSLAHFMATPTTEMAGPYNTWRREKGLNPCVASNTINKWKSDVRKYYCKLFETNGNAPEDHGISPFSPVGQKPEPIQFEPESRSNSIKRPRNKSTSSESGTEIFRTSKRSRSQVETTELDIGSKSQDDGGLGIDIELDVEDRGSNKRSMLPKRGQKTAGSFDLKKVGGSSDTLKRRRKSKDQMKTADHTKDKIPQPNHSVRPRRSNTYRAGALREVDDDRISKRSRSQIETTRLDIGSKPQNDTGRGIDIELNVEDRASNKRAMLRKRGQKAAGSFDVKKVGGGSDTLKRRQKSKDKMKTADHTKEQITQPNHSVRPRRSKTYRAGDLREVDDDINDTDSNGSDSENGVPIALPRPVKTRNDVELEIFCALPEEAISFLKTIDVTTPKAFLSFSTGYIADTYCDYRRKIRQKPLKGSGAAAKVSSWKRIVKNAAIAKGEIELANTTSTTQVKKKSSNKKLSVESSIDDGVANECYLCGDGGDLIVCDGCDKTYHLECVNLDDVPQGLWYCTDCNENNEDNDTCVVCNDGGKLIICDACENPYHLECVGLRNIPKEDWFCPKCSKLRRR